MSGNSIANRHLYRFQLSLIIVTTVISSIPTQVYAGFPGKGDEAAWRRANNSFSIGQILADSGKYEDSISNFKKAIEIYPDDPDFYCGMGNSLEKLNRPGDAERCYRDAIQRNSNSANAWFNLANILSKSPRLSEAQSAYERAYKIAPNSFIVCLKYGVSLMQKNQSKEALAVLQKSLPLAQSSVEKKEAQQYIDQLSLNAPAPVTSARIFKISLQAGAASTQIMGTDGLYVYSGAAGQLISQKGMRKVLELVLIDVSGKRMNISQQEAVAIMKGRGLAALKAKGWAGEVRPVKIRDLDPQTEIGSQFIVPPPI